MSPQTVVSAAQGWLGTPYRHRASTVGAGCDCLGLLRGVWRTLYGEEPVAVPPYRVNWRGRNADPALRLAAEQYLVTEERAPQPGQVVLFKLAGAREPHHCAILIAPHRFIHAQEHLGVVEANLTPGWARRISGRYSFPDAE